jgi:hypothetical protein
VAVATKKARIVWVLLTTPQDYPPATGEGQPTQASVAAVRREAGNVTKEYVSSFLMDMFLAK